MNTKTILLCALILAALACRAFPLAQDGGNVEPPPPPKALATPTATPTGTTLALPQVFGAPGSSEQAPATPPAPDALTAELESLLLRLLPPTPTPAAQGDSGWGAISEVGVIPLQTAAGSPGLWAAFSQGMRGLEPLQAHFVAVYAHDAAGWKEVSRTELEAPDILGSVEQILFGSAQGAPDGIWLLAQGGVGAHGGCANLLYFDGKALQPVLANCNSSPPAGRAQDLNADGVPEILLDMSDYYVFCYACGVRAINYQVWHWDGIHLVEARLARLPRPADARLVELNDRAVVLAQADLWKDAQETISQAHGLAGENATVIWNKALIDLQAGERRQALEYTSFPLLTHVFYGDYAAALDMMRAYTPEQIFSANSPLIAGSSAEGWDGSLAHWLGYSTTRALQVRYDLAAAHFLHAWAAYLANPADPVILSEVSTAADIDPDESLYARCLEYLK